MRRPDRQTGDCHVTGSLPLLHTEGTPNQPEFIMSNHSQLQIASEKYAQYLRQGGNLGPTGFLRQFLEGTHSEEEVDRFEKYVDDIQESEAQLELQFAGLPQLPHELDDKLADNVEIVSQLGSGSFGNVFLVEGKRDGRLFALKLVKTPFDEDRFHKECELLKQLRHPKVARYVASGDDGGTTPWLVMDYVEGTSLDESRQGQAVPP